MAESGVGIEDVLNQIIWMKSLPDIVDTIVSAGAIVVISLVVFSALQCFFGYAIFRYEMAITGAAVLGVGTYLGCRFLLHYTGFKLYAWTAFATCMGAGMLFTVSAIMVFLMTVLTVTAGLMIGSNVNKWNMLPQVIIVLALAIGLVAAIFYKHVIIITSSMLGAAVIGLLISNIFESTIFGLVTGIVLGILGLVMQYWMYIIHRRKEKQKDLLAQKQLEKKKAEKEKMKTDKLKEQSFVIDEMPSLDEMPDSIRIKSNMKPEVGVDSPLNNDSDDSDVKTYVPKRTQQPATTAGSIQTAQVELSNPLLRAKASKLDAKKAEEDARRAEVEVEPPVMTETGTISVGELRSKMKQV